MHKLLLAALLIALATTVGSTASLNEVALAAHITTHEHNTTGPLGRQDVLRASGDRVIDFDTPPAPAEWATVVGQYHDLGVDFVAGGDARQPVIRNVGSRAHSGSQVAAELCSVDFCSQDVAASFTQLHQRVSVWVGLLGPSPQTRKLTLSALSLDGSIIATDAKTLIGAGDGAVLVVDSPTDRIAGIRITTGSPAAIDWAIDDLTFDVATPTAVLDAGRVTQGIDHDVRALVDYDGVAGKDTLVQAQFSGTGAPAVESAECRVEHSGAAATTVPAVWTGAGTPHVNAKPSVTLDGQPTFDCVIPGTDLRSPGSYTFSAYVHLKGGVGEQGDTIATRTLEPSADIRLLIYPWMVRPGDPNYRAYSPASLLTLAQTMASFQRIWPTRAGVGDVRETPPKPGEILPGVRYHVAPPYQCLKPSVGSTLDCDTETRNIAELARVNWNASASYDRFDWAYTLAQSADSGGGSSCWFGRTAGGAQDLKPPATTYQANILVQELAHCLGAVAPTSPNYDPAHPQHAKTVLIPMTGQPPAIDMLTGAAVTAPTSVMYYIVARDATAFFEGQEWDQIRANTIGTSLGLASSSFATPAASAARTFVWMGAVDAKGHARLQYAFARSGMPDPPLQQSPAGGFELVVRSAGGAVLARRPVAVRFTATHVGSLPRAAVFAEVPLPAGAASVSLVAGKTQLAGVRLAGASPVVRGVRLTRERGGLLVRWHGSDRDSHGLRYAVTYEQPQKPPLLLAAGLEGTSYLLPLPYLAATSAGRVVVEASDGVHTGQGRSTRFSVPRGKPLALIVAPGAQVRAGEVSLVGIAYDVTDGAFGGSALRWVVDGQLQGTGERLVLRLAPGSHLVTLKVRSTGGQTVAVSRTVVAGG